DGTWGSTQATVLALRALLAEAAAAGPAAGAGAGAGAPWRVRASLNGGAERVLEFAAGQADVMQQLAFGGAVRPGPNVLRLALEGAGAGAPTWQAVARAWVRDTFWPGVYQDPPPWPPQGGAARPQDPGLSLHTRFGPAVVAVGEIVRAEIQLSTSGPEATGMVVVTAQVPVGFEIEPSGLETYSGAGTVEKYEIGQGQVTFYVREVRPGYLVWINYRLRARHAARVRVPAAEAYEFYAPERRVRTAFDGSGMAGPLLDPVAFIEAR
ncbi:MAG: hypothetical protein HZA54_15880, partial [Planctomycetes bacterium]|nr:hypothetical protein [Planctomycetota bacterium]